MDREGWEDWPMDPFGFRDWEQRQRESDRGSENHQRLVSNIVYAKFRPKFNWKGSPIRSPRFKGGL